jgi:ArsR family transcriptional regulator
MSPQPKKPPATTMDLRHATQHFRLLADPTRLRLLLLLDQDELSVAELAGITQLAQPRVSTHLWLKEAGLVSDRRDRCSYTGSRRPSPIPAWKSFGACCGAPDPLIQRDIERISAGAEQPDRRRHMGRLRGRDMERHYSPGRTWRLPRAASCTCWNWVTCSTLHRVTALAKLLAPTARSIVCLDLSEPWPKPAGAGCTPAATSKLQSRRRTCAACGRLGFDTVLLMHALTYTREPATVFAEATRVLRRGGKFLAVTLRRHRHEKAVEPYNHVNLGFTTQQLERFAVTAGLRVQACTVSATERRTPNFSVLSLSAVKP